MNEQNKSRFASALKLQDAGQLESAMEIAVDLIQKEPNSLPVLALIGDLYWKLGQLQEAVDVFKRAVELAPSREGFSLGLFHCLWELGKRVEALEEVKRFQSISDSEDYRRIVNEINQKRE